MVFLLRLERHLPNLSLLSFHLYQNHPLPKRYLFRLEKWYEGTPHLFCKVYLNKHLSLLRHRQLLIENILQHLFRLIPFRQRRYIVCRPSCQQLYKWVLVCQRLWTALFWSHFRNKHRAIHLHYLSIYPKLGGHLLGL